MFNFTLVIWNAFFITCAWQKKHLISPQVFKLSRAVKSKCNFANLCECSTDLDWISCCSYKTVFLWREKCNWNNLKYLQTDHFLMIYDACNLIWSMSSGFNTVLPFITFMHWLSLIAYLTKGGSHWAAAKSWLNSHVYLIFNNVKV